MKRRQFITDKELASILEVNQSTISRTVKHPENYDFKDSLTNVSPVIIGGRRRWPVAALAKSLGITEDAIVEACE